MKSRLERYIKICAITLSVLCFLWIVAFVIYVNIYYHANEEALAYTKSTNQVEVTLGSDQELIFTPKTEANVSTGLIFYPGGKVEYTSYAPLMNKLAQKGILCILLKVRCNLAIMDINAAKGIQEQYPEIQNWYLGGHSLGGVTASMYLKKHADEYKGIVLLGAYSTSDFTKTDLSVLSLYGEYDGVLNKKEYNESKANLPQDFTEYVIPGGCHAYFGSYGKQKGDGQATISPEEQQDIVAEQIVNWIK